MLQSEYCNIYGEPMPCDTWKRLTGAKIKPRDFVDLFSDVLAVIPGKAGETGQRNVKDRIVLRTPGVAQPAPPVTGRSESEDLSAAEIPLHGDRIPIGNLQREAGGAAGGGGGGGGMALYSPSISTPKFGFEEEADDVVGGGLHTDVAGNRLHASPAAFANGAGGTADVGGRGGADKANKNVQGRGSGGGLAGESPSPLRREEAKELLHYKEFVRQMVAHSKGRGMSATKIQVCTGAMCVSAVVGGWGRCFSMEYTQYVHTCMHAHTLTLTLSHSSVSYIYVELHSKEVFLCLCNILGPGGIRCSRGSISGEAVQGGRGGGGSREQSSGSRPKEEGIPRQRLRPNVPR